MFSEWGLVVENPFKNDNQSLYISVESLRRSITNRIIPLLFTALLINMLLSLSSIPAIGFHPLMLLYAFLLGVSALLYLFRKRIRPDITAFVIVGILLSLLFSGAASIGVLSTKFILGPMIALYLMVLGYRKTAYASVIVVFAYLTVIGILFVNGFIEPSSGPSAYMRSYTSWLMVLLAVGSVSIAFLVSFELLAGILRESDERFLPAFEKANVGICLTGLDGRLLKVNDALCEMLGYDRGGLERMNISEITYPEDRAESLSYIMDVPIGGKEKIVLEKRYLHKQGSIVWANVSSSLIRDSEHNPQYFITHVLDITKRKRAEDELLETEESLHAMFESSKDAIGVSKSGVYIYANPSYAKLFGFENNEAIAGTSASESFAPNYRHLISEHAEQRHAREPLPKFFESRAVKVNGAEFDAEVSLSSYALDGEAYSLAIIRDISERKHEEEISSRLSSIVEYSDDIIISKTLDGVITSWNKGAERIYGYTEAEMIGRPVSMLLPAENAEDLPFILEKIARGEHVVRYETQRRKKDGTFFDVSLTISPMWNTDGVIIGASTIGRDISELKRAVEQLRRLSLAVEQNPASIIITDNQGNIEYANPKFTQVSGYSTEEARGKNSRFLKSGETPPEEYKRMWKLITSGKDWRGELRNRKKSGELHWEMVSISPVKNVNGVITNFVAVKEDITSRKLAEESSRHAQKLETIGTLAGGIAHDFNNLLNAIIGQSSLALGRLPMESAAEVNILKAIKAAERAADLTRQLLAYSGKGKFIIEEIDFNRMVEENGQLLNVSISKSVTLRYDLDPTPLYIHGDVGQIQQVIMNLIINGSEAIGAYPGTITVSTGHIEIAEDDMEYSLHSTSPLEPGKYALLQVADTGHGMTPKTQARIFDPFFTTKFTGRGLGLAAVLGIIRGHKGGVRIESEVGKGSTFRIIFPLTEAVVANDKHDVREKNVIDGKGQTVLAIDDEPSVLELLQDVFSGANFKVIEASNPIDGIDLYRLHQHEIAMVILDYSMPGMDGKAAFEEIVKINKEISVILCSGYTEEEMKSGFGDVRPQAFIQKPYRPTDLLEKAAEILSAKRYRT